MRQSKWAGVVLGLAALLTGCKGFWDPVSNSGGGGTASGVFYVLNQASKQVAGFSITASSSTPTAVTGSPWSPGATPLAMAIAPSGTFLYVSTTSGIYLYDVGSGGALTLANNNQVISQDPATSMVVDPTGQWLVEVIAGSGNLNAVPLSTSDGTFNSTLSEKTVALPVTTAQQVAISPANLSSPYVFVAMGSGGTAVSPFTAGNTNPFGNISTIKVLNTSGGANTVGVDPTNRLLYVGETVAVSGSSNSGQTGGLRVFTIGSTSIDEISGSPYPTAGTGPSAILPTASYVYVANKAVSGSSSGNITGFSITTSGTTYSLTTVNTVASGVSTVGLAEDSSSTYLLAASSGGSPDLYTYTFDATTPGKLVAGTKTATGTDPVQAIAVVAVP